MRDILFRGKQTINGDWVKGNLFIPCKPDTPTQILVGTNVYRVPYDVIPETVGQYTGLTDKNGKKIFEGDILTFSDRLIYVHWHDYCGCWDFSYLKAINGKATLYEDRSPKKWGYNAIVVGNIHDNPELLKEGGQRC